jgi:hypothetical protein
MRMNKACLAIAAAGIAMASAGLTSALPAAASPAPALRPAITAVIDTNFAGYVTGGNWRFGYVAADVPVAGCRSAANQNALAGIALKSNIFSEVAHIDLRCGGGHGSVMFGTAAEAEGHFQLSPAVGDVLRISIASNAAACRDEFIATNTRTHNTKMVTVSTPCQVVYRHAVLGASLTDISGTWTPPLANVRLWEFRNVAITSYNGTHGTTCGPWPAGKHLAAPVITVRMIPADPSNSCRNFSVLLKGLADVPHPASALHLEIGG